MNLGPSKNEQDHRERLANVIARRAKDIEERWLEKVRADLPVRKLSPSELRDSMPEYLVRLAESLRQSDSAEEGGSASWANVAREHAETRVRLGFDIDQLVREFVLLRRVLFDIIEEEGVAVDFRQGARLADLIEGAIEAAVQSYVKSRDCELRKREAEHVAFITHELRNPLTTAILGANQLRRPSTSRVEQGQLLDIIDRNLRRLSDLIEGVLLVEKSVHEIKPELTVTSLGQLLAATLPAAKLAAEAKNVRLETRFDPDLVVQVDPKLSTSAIDNVVQNALKYTDRGEIRLVVEDHGNEVVLHVYDSGSGIDEEDMRRLFEPFHRGASTKPGSGLGLAIARRAVEAQGGTIHGESKKDEGSHFWLSLPKPRH